ncbi:MAG: tyrosine-type recombinase/integrase [Proteobacteria bacterium]|nr:tyrosine-type recombinase/integrase [Pseudomonadota bacterium]
MDFNWHWPDGSVVQRGPRLAYDIETNGLLPDVSTIHSLVVIDVDSGAMMSCAKGPSGTPEGYRSIEDGLAYLNTASMAVGHNVYSYDSPVIKHLRPNWEPPFQRDTLILAKMIWPVDRLKELDFPRWRKGKLPGNLIGAHKLEAWGYRLGQMKGEYSATVKELSKECTQHGDLSKVPEEYHILASADAKGRPILDPWLAWNKPMQDYCEQDVRVTVELFKLIESHLNGTAKPAHGIAWSPRCVELEHRVWLHCDKQAERGFGYDLEQAIKLTSKLRNRQRELEEELKAAFGSWWQPSAAVTPKIARNVKRADLPNITARRIRKKEQWWLRPDDMEKVIKHLRATGDDLFADIVEMICYQGFRVMECLSLRERHFIGLATSTPKVQVPGTKTNKSGYTIPVFDLSIDLVNKCIKRSKENGWERLFPISWRQARDRWAYVREYLGVQDVPSATMKSLRRTFAAIADSRGMGTKTLQEILRHENISTTELYLNVIGAERTEHARKFMTRPEAPNPPSPQTPAVDTDQDRIQRAIQIFKSLGPTPEEVARFTMELLK